MLAMSPIAGAPIAALYVVPTVAPPVQPPAGGKIDISQIHPARIVLFGGSGSRVTPFEGSGSRVTRYA